MPWHPTVWPMVKGVSPWSNSRAVASLYSAHICRRVCWRYAGRLITTSPRQAIAGQVCCDSHAMPPTPLGRLDSPNANPPILPSPGRKRARLSAAPRWRRARPLPCGGSESHTSPGPSSILCSRQSRRTRYEQVPGPRTRAAPAHGPPPKSVLVTTWAVRMRTSRSILSPSFALSTTVVFNPAKPCLPPSPFVNGAIPHLQFNYFMITILGLRS